MQEGASACGQRTPSNNRRSLAIKPAGVSPTQHTKETAGRPRFTSQVSSDITCVPEVFPHAQKRHATLTGVTVLVDPWLEGDLVFANQTWLYRGSKGALNDVELDLDQIGSQADVILLSQVGFSILAAVRCYCAVMSSVMRVLSCTQSPCLHATSAVLMKVVDACNDMRT